MGTAKRIEWVDIGKFVCMMFVMMAHMESNTVSLRSLYLPFFLTGFLFLSGYVYRPAASFKEHFTKKFKGLFIPWLIFSHLLILMSAVVSLRSEFDLAAELFWNWMQIRGLSDGMWFIAALFVAFIPFYFMIKANKPKIMLPIAGVLSFVGTCFTEYADASALPWGVARLPWHLEYVFTAVLWMMLGYYFKLYAEKDFDRFNTVSLRCAALAVYLAAIVILSAKGLYLPTWCAIVIQYLLSVLGVALLTGICKVLKSNRYFIFVGTNTLAYFATHGKVKDAMQLALRKIAGGFYSACLANELTSSILAVALTILLSLILIPVIMIINRLFPWTVGRKRPKK